jgi:gas vesicle protein
MNTTRHIAIGILAGVAVGITLGMLYSPGTVTSAKRVIRRKGNDIVDEVSDTIQESIERFTDIVTEKVEMLKNDLHSRINA